MNIRGSTILTERFKEHQLIANITDWVVLSPLELKMHIVAQKDPKAAQENKCNICLMELFDPFDELQIPQIA